jgi:transposase
MTRQAGAETRVAELEAEIGRLRSENADLRAQVGELESAVSAHVELGENLQEQLADLRSKLATTSQNSSKPPSSDRPGAPPRRRKSPKSKRKKGGQHGHEGNTRKPVPPEDVDHTVDCRPEKCQHCGEKLDGEDPQPRRHQVIEIPDPRVIVTEYLLHALACPSCRAITRAGLPKGVPASAFGPRMHAMVGLMVGRFRLSKRLIVLMLEVLYKVQMSPATVCAMEKRVSSALAVPVEAARTAIRESEVVGCDETGWRSKHRKAWLWLASTDTLAVFTIARRRSSRIVKEILGTSFDGLVCSDRWSAYSYLERRQLCWAHILRDFIAMEERFHSPWHGHRLAGCARAVMRAVAEREPGPEGHAAMVSQLESVRVKTKQYLEWTAKGAPGPKARAKAREILKVEKHLWAFLEDATIPVTNNLRERLLRYAVIWRKLSYGTQSDTGARFMERILSVCASLQLQDRDPFEYLTTAVEAHFRGHPAPSILPSRPDG